MNAAMNARREHLRLSQRTHYVITNGGDQPNVVPSVASVWYYFRELDYKNIKRNFDIGIKVAEAAAMMSGRECTMRTGHLQRWLMITVIRRRWSSE